MKHISTVILLVVREWPDIVGTETEAASSCHIAAEVCYCVSLAHELCKESEVSDGPNGRQTARHQPSAQINYHAHTGRMDGKSRQKLCTPSHDPISLVTGFRFSYWCT